PAQILEVLVHAPDLVGEQHDRKIRAAGGPREIRVDLAVARIDAHVPGIETVVVGVDRGGGDRLDRAGIAVETGIHAEIIGRARRRPRRNPTNEKGANGAFVTSLLRLFAVELLLELAALLRLDRQRRGRSRDEALDADRLAGLLAVAVAAVLDARERGIDLLQEL